MSELFIELFSEEIPARMQRGATAELERAITAALAAIVPANIATWFGPSPHRARPRLPPRLRPPVPLNAARVPALGTSADRLPAQA